jgi:tRNA A-37 threonylcarbamoyl transferase component Bud32
MSGMGRALGLGRAWLHGVLSRVGLASFQRSFDTRAYRRHRARQNRLRIAWIAAIAVVFYPGFAVLDAVAYPEHLAVFVTVRLTVTAMIVVCVSWGWRRAETRFGDFVVLMACGLAQAGILAMILAADGGASSYWAGLLVVNAAYIGLSPHGGRLAALFFGCVQAAYAVACHLAGARSAPAASASLVQPNFFLGAGGTILVIVSAFTEVSRRQAFLAKVKIAEQEAEIERARAARAEALERARPGWLLGRTLSRRYRMTEVLGRGGAGEVYLADDVVAGGRCAIKVLHPDLADREDAVRRFLQEAENASAVASEHVAQVRDTGCDPIARLFLVMEYVPGEDLGARLQRRGRLGFDELMPIVEQIAHVLEATHRAGIVHRDLKPKNVLIAARGGAPFVKLIDFGISKMVGPETTATAATGQAAVLGTVGFMSPEQAIGLSGSVGPAADVFALASIVYRALTGRLAFSDEGLAGFCLRVSDRPFVAVEDIDAALHPDVTLVLAMGMARHPADRVASPLELMRLLELARGGRLDASTRARATRFYHPDGAPPDARPTLQSG